MKQIFVGSTQRSKLYAIINKTLLPTRLVLAAVFLLLVLIPLIFSGKIFKQNGGDLSNIVFVNTGYGTGSAILIGNNQLLTAAHVLEGMSINDRCEIEFRDPKGEKDVVYAEAEILAVGKFFPSQNPEEDYALLHVLHIDASEFAKPCTIGSGDVAPGEQVTIIGYPAGAYSYTQGSVSNVNGGLLGEHFNLRELYAVNASAWHGNSGGALFDSNNQLIGIVTMIGNIQGYNDGQTYALKISKVKNVLNGKGFVLQ